LSTSPTLAKTTRRSVELDGQGLLLGDDRRRLALYSGSLHYWQLDRERWPEILRSIRSLGFSCIDTYIPWSVHEQSPGDFSFEGDRDVEAFLELCHSEEMFVIARPGPHINAELTEFGYPPRLVNDGRMQARTASGAPGVHVIPPKAFPIISYCSDEFYAEVEGWFDVVCPIIARHQYPDGPIVLVQADNEHSYFFKLTPYDVDYSDGAVAHYRSVLREKYGTIEALNSAYNIEAHSFDDVDPPRKFEAETRVDLPRYLDWALTKERYLTDGVRRIASMLETRGVDRVPISHNSPGWFGVPYDHVAIESAVDVQGVDFYVHRDGYEYLKRGCLYLAGTARLPFIPEFGAGTWPWFEPINNLDAESNVLTALMHGVKAINYYMLVERDRWLGSPIGRRGDIREDKARLYRRLLRFLQESDWTSVERETSVLLLYVREYERLAFVSRAVSPPFFPEMLGPLADLSRHELVVDRNLGFEHVIPRDVRTRFDGLNRELSALHHGYAISDSESSLEALQRVPVLIAPSYEFMTRSTQQKLRSYAEQGGQLLIGPTLPSVDETGAPCTLLADSGSERIRVLAHPHELGAAIAEAGIASNWDIDNSELDLAVHRGAGRTYCFVANPTAQPQSGSLRVPGVSALRDAWRLDRVVRGNGQFDLVLEAHEIQVWSC
jgi:beta-galactosidase